MECHEIVISRSAEEASRDEVVAAARRLQRWAVAQPGFIRRTLVDGGEGTWVDLVVWRSEAEAKAASIAFETNAAAAEISRVLDVKSIRMIHGTAVALD